MNLVLVVNIIITVHTTLHYKHKTHLTALKNKNATTVKMDSRISMKVATA